jgi:hypothetical protein
LAELCRACLAKLSSEAETDIPFDGGVSGPASPDEYLRRVSGSCSSFGVREKCGQSWTVFIRVCVRYRRFAGLEAAERRYQPADTVASEVLGIRNCRERFAVALLHEP